MTGSLFAICGYLVLVLNGWITCTSDNKRLVLHSDVDIAAAIQTLTARLESMSTEMGHMASELQTLNAQNYQLASEVQTLKTTSYGGSVYTRWGRSACSQNGSELIYAG
ncbi:hypothetical protein DPMN_169480 [Dreissena polymorpha]|uniref:Coil containing protein n=1 Tax=Dreissena polymorpha TaxID=45954 RepID=A0A9D4DW43_DREPO|nr:hypothetical protein DPMN_169480 [Dreissena polymorpha]